MRVAVTIAWASLLSGSLMAQQPLRLTDAQYEDRVLAAWTGQIIATLMGFQFEHKTASTLWIDRFPRPYESAPVDDDHYYELVALRGFERYGIDMTLDELGEQWKENSAGSWGSSEQARLRLAQGVKGSETGHPRYNKLWFTIGPQFSADLYGLLAPGDANLAGRLARTYGRINGHAEAVDGAVFVAGMVSLAFRATDAKAVMRDAARLIHPSSPYRQALDLVISMAGEGKPPDAIFQAIEDRWHIDRVPGIGVTCAWSSGRRPTAALGARDSEQRNKKPEPTESRTPSPDPRHLQDSNDGRDSLSAGNVPDRLPGPRPHVLDPTRSPLLGPGATAA